MFFLSIPVHNGHKWLVNARHNLAEVHSRVYRMFPPVDDDGGVDVKSGQRYGIRWRIEQRDPHNPGSREYLLVQSDTEPALHYHYPELSDYEIREIPPTQPMLTRGQLIEFSFVGNPTRSRTSPSGKSRRVPLTDIDEIRRWGADRLRSVHDLPQAGPWAELVTMTSMTPAYSGHPMHVAYKGDGTEVRLSLWRFRGIARIIDPPAARAAVHRGIRTPARGYGTGMLTVADARPH